MGKYKNLNKIKIFDDDWVRTSQNLQFCGLAVLQRPLVSLEGVIFPPPTM